MDFNIQNLHEIYEIEKCEKEQIGELAVYMIGNDRVSFAVRKDSGNIYTEIIILTERFLSQKRCYSTNLPVKKLEEFEFVLKIAGIELKRRQKQYYIIDTSIEHGKYCSFHSIDCGFTWNLDKAKKYTENEAIILTEGHNRLKRYQCESVDFLSQRTILKTFLPAANV